MKKMTTKLLLMLALLLSATGYAQISGPDSVCAFSTTTYTATTSGGMWSTSSATVGFIDASTGLFSSAAGGTVTITYTPGTMGGGYYTKDVTVVPPPTLVTSASPAPCSNTCAFAVSGALTYAWSPATGLSCTTCSSPTVTFCGIGAYSLTTTGPIGCTTSIMMYVSVDYILGHITFTGTPPAAPSLKVWLVQFDPVDSSITATDSVMTCMDGSDPYFSFYGKPTGSYMLKAKLEGTTPGTSGYIPTYGASTPYWYSAMPIVHTVGATDLQDIDMIYGTVPLGPGFMSGYVYTGAGKGTAGIPAVGMLVYLKNAAGQVLTYTYTTATGAYSFSGLAYGSYVIYPEAHRYYTTPTGTIVLSATTPTYASIDFRQYTTSRKILPYTVPTSILTSAAAGNDISVYPNPATHHAVIVADQLTEGMAQLSLTDMTGRSVYAGEVAIGSNGRCDIDLSSISPATYILRITAQNFTYTGRLTKQP